VLDAKALPSFVPICSPAEVGERPHLAKTEGREPHSAEVVAERILGVGGVSPIAEDWRVSCDLGAERLQVAIQNARSAVRERPDGLPPCLGPCDAKGVPWRCEGVRDLTSTGDMLVSQATAMSAARPR
jgi:hypothetical protein